jgi:hypothetical protein
MGGICGGFFGFWEKKSQEKVISDNRQVDRFGSD